MKVLKKGDFVIFLDLIDVYFYILIYIDFQKYL